MIKKVFKYALVGMLFLLTIFNTSKVNAESYAGQAIWPSEKVDNVYFRKERPDGEIRYKQAQFFRRSEDNKFVYCLEPYEYVNNTYPFYEVIREDYANVLGFTEEQWERISLLAYYGYQYNENGYDHHEAKWYPITQVMIWRTTNPDSDIYFTDTLNGNRTSKFDGEMAELDRLVSEHYKTPQFGTNMTLPIGSTIELTDSNNVLSNYKITGTNNIEARIEGNKLYITTNSIGEATINLEKKATKYEVPPIVYINTHSQNVFRLGEYDPVKAKLTVKVVGGKVTINKKDIETRTNTPQGEASLNGAVYGIYNLDGNKISTITTDENGISTSNLFNDLGRFYLLEETPSKGYLLDSNKYYFEITEDNLNPTVEVFEQVIKSDFEFTKVYASSNTGFMEPEVGIKFGIYNSNNVKIKEVITDNQGVVRFTLPYGKYVVKQLTTTPGHEKITDFDIEVNKEGQVLKKVISNAPITTKLRVVKIDSETKEVIKRANIKFKIFDVKNNEYVCQRITYPIQNNICEFETNQDGEFITPYPLIIGTYRLEEVDQAIDGYLWNNTSLEFTINENTQLRTDSKYGIIFDTTFENTRVKGEIEINKLGEVAKLTSDGYEYKEEKLEGIKFGLYALEDIIWNGNIIYTKDSLISEKTTNSNGIIKFSDLYLGKYYVKEISTLDSYVLDETKYNIELKYKDQYTQVVKSSKTILNKIKTSKLDFTKTDYSESKTLPNTLIEIYTNDNQLVFKGRTDSNGKIVIDRLPQGKYYILEKEAPVGYVLNNGKMYFEVKDNGEIIKSIMKDEEIIGSLEFTKVDFSNDNPLPDTLIEIYTNDDKLVFSGRTDENGFIKIDELKYGKYYILEKEAPIGYVLNEDKMYFEIKNNNEIVKATMKDEKITGTLEFTKQDFLDNEPLPNTLIEIYNEETDELIFSGRTDENGMVIIEKLEYGKYYILEKEAPEEYEINEEKMYFEIKENGEVIKSTMKDQRIVKVPNTESNDYKELIITGSLLMILGIGIIIYGRKKNKK